MRNNIDKLNKKAEYQRQILISQKVKNYKLYYELLQQNGDLFLTRSITNGSADIINDTHNVAQHNNNNNNNILNFTTIEELNWDQDILNKATFYNLYTQLTAQQREQIYEDVTRRSIMYQHIVTNNTIYHPTNRPAMLSALKAEDTSLAQEYKFYNTIQNPNKQMYPTTQITNPKQPEKVTTTYQTSLFAPSSIIDYFVMTFIEPKAFYSLATTQNQFAITPRLLSVNNTNPDEPDGVPVDNDLQLFHTLFVKPKRQQQRKAVANATNSQTTIMGNNSSTSLHNASPHQ